MTDRHVTDLVCLEDGCAAPWFVVEFVFWCERAGVLLEVIDHGVIATSTIPHAVADDVRDGLRRWGPGVREVLLHLPGDSPDRRF